MSKICSKCGSKESGSFCSQCGGSLEALTKCGRCGKVIPPGGRFCNMCGQPVAAAPLPGSTPLQAGSGLKNPSLPWYIAGAALFALIVAIVVPRFTGQDPAPIASPPITAPVGDPGSVDLASMTPREAAERLFNRVMESVSAGDSAQARAFAPMAIAAYDLVEESDLDVLYHIGVLHLVSNDAAAARQVADQMMVEAPNHLFALFTAAQAETLLGDRDEAVALYARFLANYDAEVAIGRQEYSDHERALLAMRQEAVQATAPG